MKFQEVKVIITLLVPEDMPVSKCWTREQCLADYVRHWLEEGYRIDDPESGLGIKVKDWEVYYGRWLKVKENL